MLVLCPLFACFVSDACFPLFIAYFFLLIAYFSLFIRKTHSVLRCPARLACVRHAASVHPEPGSNSHLNLNDFHLTLGVYKASFACLLFSFALVCFSPTFALIFANTFARLASYQYKYWLALLYITSSFSLGYDLVYLSARARAYSLPWINGLV